jgi:hypothetical protein
MGESDSMEIQWTTNTRYAERGTSDTEYHGVVDGQHVYTVKGTTLYRSGDASDRGVRLYRAYRVNTVDGTDIPLHLGRESGERLLRVAKGVAETEWYGLTNDKRDDYLAKLAKRRGLAREYERTGKSAVGLPVSLLMAEIEAANFATPDEIADANYQPPSPLAGRQDRFLPTPAPQLVTPPRQAKTPGPWADLDDALEGVTRAARQIAEQAARESVRAADQETTTELVDRIVRRARYDALKTLLSVLDGWIEGSRSNHEALDHRTSFDGCCGQYAPEDIRAMVNDAARDLGTPLPVVAR